MRTSGGIPRRVWSVSHPCIILWWRICARPRSVSQGLVCSIVSCIEGVYTHLKVGRHKLAYMDVCLCDGIRGCILRCRPTTNRMVCGNWRRHRYVGDLFLRNGSIADHHVALTIFATFQSNLYTWLYSILYIYENACKHVFMNKSNGCKCIFVLLNIEICL